MAICRTVNLDGVSAATTAWIIVIRLLFAGQAAAAAAAAAVESPLPPPATAMLLLCPRQGVRLLGLLLVAVASCGAQIFPFSNLKHIFEQKGKGKHGSLSTADPPSTTPSSTTMTTPSTDAPATTPGPYHGPFTLYDEDDGYRQFRKPDDVVLGGHDHQQQQQQQQQQQKQHAKPWPALGQVGSTKPRPAHGKQPAAVRPGSSSSSQKHAPQLKKNGLLQQQQQQQQQSTASSKKHGSKRPPEQHGHHHRPQPGAAPPRGSGPHFVPIKIAYEPTSPDSPAGTFSSSSSSSSSSSGKAGTNSAPGDVHAVLAPPLPGDSRPQQPPPLFLTPPRLNANNHHHHHPVREAEAAFSSPSSSFAAPPHAARPTTTTLATSAGIDVAPHPSALTPTTTGLPSAASTAGPLPPVPAVFLRPPGPPSGPSGPSETPVLFRLGDDGVGGGRGGLRLADVADAALAHSTNPGILLMAEKGKPTRGRAANSSSSTPANHKLTPAPHNALAGPPPHPPPPPGHGLGPSKLGGELTNDKHGKQQQQQQQQNAKAKGGPFSSSSSRPAAPTDAPLDLVESSAAESSSSVIALGPPSRTPANHRPGLRPLPPAAPPHQQQHHHHQQQQLEDPQHQRAAKFKNHKPGPLGPARPVKYRNHRPGNLDGEESMASPRYQKRPLGPIEQEVAASGLQHTGQYPSSGDGERVEFQMHGQHGPESYKFGYDTGSGHNRQFRYEERDPHGNVKGHYGYVDQHGKLQVVNYKADSKGYSADVSKLHP